MNWYLKALKQYADFNGRARRKEYWMYTLFNFIFAVAAIVVDMSFGSGFEEGIGFMYSIYVLGTFIPSLAVAVRRLHDISKSGWMMLVSLIPIVGGIWLLVLMCTEGDKGANAYGLDPKTDPNYEIIDEIGRDN